MILHITDDCVVALTRFHVVRKLRCEVQDALDKLRVKVKLPTTIPRDPTILGKLRQKAGSDWPKRCSRVSSPIVKRADS
jgi:hypothetical protein